MQRLLLAAAACTSLAGPGLAEPGRTIAPAAMRRLPSVKSHVVQHIPADAEIDVSHCGGGWCYASWRNLFGYVPSAAVAAGPSGAMPPPAAYAPYPPPAVAAPPPVAEAPAWGWSGPYVGFGWGYGWGRW